MTLMNRPESNLGEQALQRAAVEAEQWELRRVPRVPLESSAELVPLSVPAQSSGEPHQQSLAVPKQVSYPDVPSAPIPLSCGRRVVSWLHGH